MLEDFVYNKTVDYLTETGLLLKDLHPDYAKDCFDLALRLQERQNEMNDKKKNAEDSLRTIVNER